MKKKLLTLAVVLLVTACCWQMRHCLLPFFCDDPLPFIEAHFSTGGAFTDRHGRVLRVFPDVRGDLSVYMPLASHSADLVAAVLTAEDRDFFSHPGFNLKSIVRAAWQNVSSGRIVSGASTVTQQLIRVVRPRPRNLATKVSEILMALRLETEMGKQEILERYLNAVSMFGNVRGVNMAAHTLFGKSAEMLNVAESAALAAAIQAPGRYDPFSRNGNFRLLRRRNWVLSELLKTGKIDASQHQAAAKEQIPTWRRRRPFQAPHFCDMLAEVRGRPSGVRRTTIDIDLQNMLTDTLAAHMPRLRKRGASQAGAMIVTARTMEIVAMAGSAEYGPLAAGFNNVCAARRSGGSILKPFLYALALESGFYPSYVIPDTMQTFKTPQGEYHPLNADRRSYGPVTVRSALGNSLNIAAVKMLNLLGVKNFYRMLVSLDLLPDKSGAADFYGLGLAIGNPELRMLDLVRAFTVFVNAGELLTLKYFADQPVSRYQIISPATAYMVFDMLSDPSARLFTFGNPSFFKTTSPVAIKTGTSTEYRDCWLIAANPEFVVAIWVGNFSGAPTRGLSGASACGPIFKNIIDYLETKTMLRPLPEPPGLRRISVCSISGQLAGPTCPHSGRELIAEISPDPQICTFHKLGNASHELSSDYASWLRQRRRYLDIDPFVLAAGLSLSDPWGEDRYGQNASPVILASGPIVMDASPVSGSSSAIRIVSPHDGDRYVMSSSHENLALLRAIPLEPVAEVIWLINGVEFARTAPPYEAYWPLVKGRHRITALTDNEAAAEIEINVEY